MKVWRREDGFTLVELTIVVTILGIITSIAVLSYSNISKAMNLNGALKQVEAALNRAKVAARQENVKYQLVFYTDSSGANADTYEFVHDVYNPGADTWTMTPVDRSVSGEEVSVSGGHAYIKVANGVKITGCTEIAGSEIIVTFAPAGTTMAVSGSDNPGGGQPPNTSATITLNLLSVDSSGSVSINAIGAITIP